MPAATPLRNRLARLNTNAGALAVVALAFALRLYRLADKNVWWDEGWTVWLSRHDLGFIALRTAADEHPPLHYWLMHYWNLAAGTDAFAGRFFSLFFGVLTVALLYRIGRRIGGSWLGLFAALLLALARFQVWWSQDIKNYTLSGFFGLLSVWFVLRLVSAPLEKWKQWEIWLGYVLSITLALYSHYLAALLFLADNLFMFGVLVREWLARRSPLTLLLRWSAAQLAVLALFAPWLALYGQHAATWTAAPAFDFGLFLRLAATVLSLGVTTHIENDAAVVSVIALLALMGALWIFIRGKPAGVTLELKWGAVFALLIVSVPPLLIYVLSLTPAAFFAPKIQARYLLILLPGYLLLVALGVRLLARGSLYLAAAAVAAVLLAQGFTLDRYFRERVLGDEYATLAQAVNSFALPGDSLVLNTDQEWPTLLYYLRPDREWPLVQVPNGQRVDATTAHRIALQSEQYQGVWVITIPDALAQDPAHLVEAELAKRWPKQYEQTFGDKRLALYSDRLHNFKDVPPDNYRPLARRADEVDNRLRLTGLDLPMRQAYPGDTIHVVTYWESQDVALVKTSLLHDGGEERPEAQAEAPISVGAHERAQADLVIPIGAEGELFGVYAQARLRQIKLGAIQVIARSAESPAAPPAAAPTRAFDARFGSAIRLTGAALPDARWRAGDSIPLTLFWQAEQPVTTSYTIFVHLLGSQYNPAQNNFLWGQSDQLPLAGAWPTTAWIPGQPVADPYRLTAAPSAPPGLYRIEVGLYDAATGARLRVTDANGGDGGDSLIIGQVEIQ